MHDACDGCGVGAVKFYIPAVTWPGTRAAGCINGSKLATRRKGKPYLPALRQALCIYPTHPARFTAITSTQRQTSHSHHARGHLRRLPRVRLLHGLLPLIGLEQGLDRDAPAPRHEHHREGPAARAIHQGRAIAPAQGRRYGRGRREARAHRRRGRLDRVLHRRDAQDVSREIRVGRSSRPLRLRHEHSHQSARVDAGSQTARRSCELYGHRKQPRLHAVALALDLPHLHSCPTSRQTGHGGRSTPSGDPSIIAEDDSIRDHRPRRFLCAPRKLPRGDHHCPCGGVARRGRAAQGQSACTRAVDDVVDQAERGGTVHRGRVCAGEEHVGEQAAHRRPLG